MQATVLIGKQRSSDTPSVLLAAFDKSFWQNVSVDVSFDLPHSVIVGKQGALEPFHFQVEGRTVDGYLLTFIRENVVVLVLEMGPSGAVTEQQILSHGQLIDQRLQ